MVALNVVGIDYIESQESATKSIFRMFPSPPIFMKREFTVNSLDNFIANHLATGTDLEVWLRLCKILYIFHRVKSRRALRRSSQIEFVSFELSRINLRYATGPRRELL